MTLGLCVPLHRRGGDINHPLHAELAVGDFFYESHVGLLITSPLICSMQLQWRINGCHLQGDVCQARNSNGRL